MHSWTLITPVGWMAATGHSLAQRWHGEPHSGQRLSQSNMRSRPGIARAAPKGHSYRQKKRSTNRLVTSKAAAKVTNGQLRTKPRTMAVLNGSTSDRRSAQASE